MQNNSLSSANELRRSGRLVYKKTLFLGKDSSKDLHKWENYSIDLAGLIHQEPGAIYRVILSFKQAVDGVDEWYQKELEGQGYDDAKELIDTFTK